ncbi:hypothetical protein NQ318_014707 [Aromia moschata]|uniref:Translation initiation factor eIF2B subunit beta n=1 Tax=Aromia moschata TaxID=1265417 RepID=A0AAV8ZDL3_9CUCU|nr:hypothetical protein NQ318_014707 [Aromia moschata]
MSEQDNLSDVIRLVSDIKHKKLFHSYDIALRTEELLETLISQGEWKSARKKGEGQSLHQLVTANPNNVLDYSESLSNLKSSLLDHLTEYKVELESSTENIAAQASEHIHMNEIILTVGKSKTVEKFLKSSAKKRAFNVMVVEGAPFYYGHNMAASLGKSNIQTTVISDSAVFAMMSRVNKVIIGTHTVLANGGLRAASGIHAVALAAKHYSVPVMVLSHMFKFTPVYVASHDHGTFNVCASPANVIPYFTGQLLNKIEVVNPVFDCVPPELVTLFISHHSVSFHVTWRDGVLLNKSNTETVALIQEAFKEAALSKCQVKKWHKMFKDGHEEVVDKARSRNAHQRRGMKTINYPFHLSRRGWGEFPLRVQIFFKCSLNKPVSIVHNLKLDKTYTGRQTLGNETIVDVYLHDNDFNLQSDGIENESPIEELDENFINDLKCELTIKEEQIDSPGVSDFVKTEPLLVNDTTEDLASTSNEHNYCYEKDIVKDNVVKDVNVTVPIPCSSTCFLLDHSYSLPYSEHKDSAYDNNTPRNKTDIKPNQSDNNLIYGLGESYTENDIEKSNVINKYRKVEPSVNVNISWESLKLLLQLLASLLGFYLRVLTSCFSVMETLCKYVSLSDLNPLLGVLTVIHPYNIMNALKKKIVINENYEVTLPKNRFKNMGEALPYLFKRLPLYSTTANCIDYKCMYPFTATSEVEFSSWNIGKRINSEWCRAKAIKKILSGENFPNLGLWNTKTFFMYGRSHGYSPFALHNGLFRRHSKEVELLKTCFLKSVPQTEFSLESGANDIVIDVTANTDSSDGKKLSSEKNNFIDISDAGLNSHCAFVKEAALDCGVTLKPEEISKGVTMNAAEG